MTSERPSLELLAGMLAELIRVVRTVYQVILGKHIVFVRECVFMYVVGSLPTVGCSMVCVMVWDGVVRFGLSAVVYLCVVGIP